MQRREKGSRDSSLGMSALAALRVIERGARTVLTTFFTLLGSSNNDEDESSENDTKK